MMMNRFSCLLLLPILLYIMFINAILYSTYFVVVAAVTPALNQFMKF